MLAVLRKGYTLPFQFLPNLTWLPTIISCYVNPLPGGGVESAFNKNAVEQVATQKSVGFYNTLFLVPKHTTGGDSSATQPVEAPGAGTATKPVEAPAAGPEVLLASISSADGRLDQFLPVKTLLSLPVYLTLRMNCIVNRAPLLMATSRASFQIETTLKMKQLTRNPLRKPTSEKLSEGSDLSSADTGL